MLHAIHENEFVTDTMGPILWLERRKMPKNAKAIFAAAEQARSVIHIPGIVFAEVLYLSEKRRIQLSLSELADWLQQHSYCREAVLDCRVIEVASVITDIPELHDRLIAATAKSLSLPLITNDPVIQQSRFVQTIWQ